MKKVLTFLLCSLYFVSIPAISTEEPLTLSQNRRYALTQTVVGKEMYFDAIPERPTTKIEISSFQDNRRDFSSKYFIVDCFSYN